MKLVSVAEQVDVSHSIWHAILPSILLFLCPSAAFQVVGIMCMQLLLQYYADSFETLQVLRSWSEDVHIV